MNDSSARVRLVTACTLIAAVSLAPLAAAEIALLRAGASR
jgi:hypothetical protein